MGISQDNWPATVGIFTGVLAKEVVVGTLDSLYTQIAAEERDAADSGAAFDLMTAFSAATATIPANLGALADRLLDPLALDVGDVSSIEAAAREQEVSAGIFGAMAARFDGQAGAFAYLLFILLYFPCVATIGAIAREAGGAWAAFVAAWTTTMAYSTATMFYQAATFAQHPASSLAWILVMGLVAVSVVAGLRIWSNRDNGRTPQASGAKA